MSPAILIRTVKRKKERGKGPSVSEEVRLEKKKIRDRRKKSVNQKAESSGGKEWALDKMLRESTGTHG
jgi:hypothetical protein